MILCNMGQIRIHQTDFTRVMCVTEHQLNWHFIYILTVLVIAWVIEKTLFATNQNTYLLYAWPVVENWCSVTICLKMLI